MKDSVVIGEVIEPYAQALFSVAQSNNLIDRFSEDVNGLLSGLEDSPELREFLSNPIIKADAKKSVLGQILGDQVHPLMRNFLMLLIDRRRSQFVEGILKQFQELVRKLNQTVLAEVVSATELNDDQKQAIRDKVISITGARQVELATRIDSDLIGGVIIRVGSQVIDASLRGQLRRISLRLTSAS
jgi:F-type H+-transporting ATPase subunit delta